jgi:hypothetical protein
MILIEGFAVRPSIHELCVKFQAFKYIKEEGFLEMVIRGKIS